MKRRRLQILEPCSEDFAAMPGGDKSRFCDKCDKNVHNVSAMTKADADAFLHENAGNSICIRMTQDAKGNIRHRAPTARRAGFVAAIALAMAACTGHGDTQELESPESQLSCYDANGYAIRCDDADEWFAPDQAEPGQAPEIARADSDPTLNDPEDLIETVENVENAPAISDEPIEDIELMGEPPMDDEPAPGLLANREGDEDWEIVGEIAPSCPVGGGETLGRYDPFDSGSRVRERRRIERRDARADRKRDRRARRRLRKEGR